MDRCNPHYSNLLILACLSVLAGCNPLGQSEIAANGSGSSDTGTSSAGGTASEVSQIIFSTQPSSTGDTDTILAQQPVVTLKDASGNIVTSSAASVTLSGYSDVNCITTVAGGLTATTNPVTAAGGVATFAGVKVLKTNVIRIGASDGTHTACSNAVTISAGAVSQLVFTTQPAGTVNTKIAFTTQPVITLKDANSNVVNSNSAITLTPYLSSNCITTPAAGTLANDTVSASSGVATFNNVSNSAAETIYLKATLGGITACSTGTVSVTVPLVVAPPSSNLSLWLKADSLSLNNGDTVSSWSDNTSNANNAVQATAGNRPSFITNAINGKPVIRFNGTSGKMTIPDSATLRSNTITLIAVFNRSASSQSWSKLILRPYYANENWSLPYESWAIEARYSNTDSLALTTSISGTYHGDQTSTITSGAFHIATLWQDGTNKKGYSDGSSIYSAALAGNIDNSQTGQNIYIGASPFGEYFKGDIAEILIYNTALGNSNRVTAECYLNQKYNLRISSCPSLTPYISTRNTNSVFTMTASGGTAPYSYSIYSGGGSISADGVFTAPSSAGTTQIQVSDANGNTNLATVYTIASSAPTIVQSGLVFNLDAALATLTGFPGSGCSLTNWFDLFKGSLIGTLTNFTACGASSGWNGSGITTDPYRLSFDGSSNVVKLPASVTAGLTKFTASFWMKSSEAGSNATYWNRPSLFGSASSGGNSGDFGINTNSGKLSMWGGLNSGGDNSLVTNLTVNDGTWHHVTATNDGSNIHLYLDGTDVGSTLSSGLALHNSYFTIGAQYQDWIDTLSYFHAGDIPQFSFYNVALSSNDVARNCNVLKSRFNGASCATFNAPTQLALSAPAKVPVSDCSQAFTVTLKDGNGSTASALNNITVTPTGLGATSLYSDSTCTTSVSSVTIPADSSTVSFYLHGSILETISVVATDAASSLTSSSAANVPVQAGDTFWSSVVLLMKMDGASFTESSNGLTVSNSNIVTQNAGPAGFGNTALFSSNNKGLSVPDSANWTIGTGNYTVEARVKFASLPGNGSNYALAGSLWSGVDTNWLFYVGNTGGTYTARIFHGRTANANIVNSTYSSSALTLTAGTWYTIAFTYDGSNIRFFLDGVLSGTVAQTGGFGDSSTSMPLMFGSGVALDNILDGELDDVRITKGVCRYTTNYSPATVPFDAF